MKILLATANNGPLAAVFETANAPTLDAPQDGWQLIAPYGEHSAPAESDYVREHGQYRQILDRAQAEKIVATWNSVGGRFARWMHNIKNGVAMFSASAPIFTGHPDADPVAFTDRDPLGKITELRAGEAGLEGFTTWNAEALANRMRGPLKPSAYWLHELPDPQGCVFPELLLSVGLWPTPNIKNAPAWTRNTTEPGTNNTMNQEELAKLLGLAPEASWDDIKAAIAKMMEAPAEKEAEMATANAAKLAAQKALATANASLKTVTDERDALAGKIDGITATANAATKAVLDLHEKAGTFTPAQRGEWDGKATANAAATLDELAKKAPALNTKQITELQTPAGLATANARMTAFSGLVDKAMKDNGGDYDKAVAAVKADPANAALIGAMQDPTRKS